MNVSILALSLLCGAPPAEDLSCWKGDPGGPAPSAVHYATLQQAAYAALDQRRATYDQLKTPEQVRAYQQRLRQIMTEQLGGFPERTPLEPRVVGKIEENGYRIEKVIFTSQPQHHVTGNLYLPNGRGPFPGVLVSSGHSRSAKASDYNQRFGIMLARHGLAALCYDPIGQGERSQILNAEGQPQFSGTTQEHFLVGVGSILVGSNTARYRIWDGMRALDYLASRPEIDPQRLGMTGCSGGGTLTSYVMALDDRVACAAPACYITTFRRLLETIGPQDAEQNIFGQLAYGLDHPDYLLLRAPRPTIVSASSGDYFDQAGTWDSVRQAKRVYSRFGFPERVDLVEADGGHGVHPANLAAITQWLRRWLAGKDGPVTIPEMKYRTEQELRCTDHGQVLKLPGERSVFDLNVAWEQQLAPARQKLWKESPQQALQKVRETVGVRKLADIPTPKWDKAGKVQRDEYHIDKLVMRTDSGVPLPALTFHPKEPREDAYLYLHEGGKMADGAPGGPIEKLVKEGYVVVAVDLRGLGETASSSSPPESLLGDWKPFYLAYLLGKSMVGLHTEDALAAGKWVAHYQTKTPRQVHLVGVGRAAPVALHAAALEPELFTTVTLRGGPRDWKSVVANPVPAGQLTTTVHGALRVYDLPDLLQSLPREKVRQE